jgi:hypothetical protein
MIKNLLSRNISKKIEKSRLEKFGNFMYIYRYDFFAFGVMIIFILYYLRTLLQSGHIVFSDIDFPFNSKRYLEEIFGLWNERWSTPTTLNLPRLIYVLPSYFLSLAFGGSGEVFFKFFLFQIVITSALSLYIFAKRLVSVYMGAHFNFIKVFSLITGSLLYAINPWVIFRIQHIYLLCGYSVFPLILLFYFKVFDIKFQRQIIAAYSPYEKKLYKQNILDIFLLAYIVTIGSAAIHYFFYTVGFFVILSILLLLKYTLKYRKYGIARLKKIYYIFMKKAVVFSIFFIGLSAYWLIMYVLSIVFGIQASQHNINALDTFVQFSRHSDIKSILFLISYWWPMFDFSEFGSSFYIGGSILLAFVGLGLISQGVKKHILTFFSLLLFLTILISTGVNIPQITPYFLILNKLPIIGNMFRDPNKLIGIVTLLYSIFIIFGFEWVNTNLGNSRYHKIIKGGMIVFMLIGLTLYLEPMKTLYVDKFLNPIKIPNAYTDLLDYQEKNPRRSLYFPIADQMLHREGKVSTPFWNLEDQSGMNYKATGDIQIYSSMNDTIFHHEGSDPNIGYYINFIQFLLDEGRSMNIGNLISCFGVDRLIYHSDYLTQEHRQKLNRDILDLQNNLIKEHEIDYIYIYELEKKAKKAEIVRHKIFSTSGLETMDQLISFRANVLDNYPVIFINNGFGVLEEHLKKDDYIEVDDKTELLMSMLDKSEMLFPFDWIDEVNPFVKWSKTYLSLGDWKWYMKTMNLDISQYDFDLNKGVAVTFASAALDVLPQNKKYIEGKLVADFDTMLRLDKFFVPDNPTLFSVVANPYSDYNDLPTLRGVIQKGEPKNIWQVAKSGYLKAKENTPYQFNLVVSGRGTNQLHVKARFFDKNQQEIGVAYVVAPEETSDFKGINFIGEYVTPPETEFMRLDLLTFQRPDQKIYWWIHDISLFDLTKYKNDNVIKGIYNTDIDGKYKVFARVFKSKKGGSIELDINDEKHEILTKNNQISRFEWVNLGEIYLEKGAHEIKLDNKKGFNAVNSISIISLQKLNEYNERLKYLIKRAKLFNIVEFEQDFNYTDTLQTKRNYLGLSLGRGISINKGNLNYDIDILKTGDYVFNTKLKYGSHLGKVQMQIYNDKGELEYKFNLDDKGKSEKFLPKVIEFDEFNREYPRQLEQANYLRLDYRSIETPSVFLKEGSYRVVFEVDSELDTLVDLSEFGKNALNKLEFPEHNSPYIEELEFGCGEINEDMMKRFKIAGGYRYEFEPTESIDWYTYASPLLNVNEGEELVVKFKARSEIVKKRHEEIIFVDRNNKWIKTTYINEVEERKKSDMNEYEQIVKVPKNAVKAGIQIKARGGSKKGFIEVRDFEIYEYDRMIIFDQFAYGEDNIANWFVDYDIDDPVVKRIDEMKYNLKLSKTSENSYINFYRSFSPAWRITPSIEADISFNAVTSGYALGLNSEFSVEMKLRKIYYICLAMHMITIIGVFFVYKRGGSR